LKNKRPAEVLEHDGRPNPSHKDRNPMTQADSVLSTPPTNAPTSRRRFLSAAATLAAGSAALGLAIPPAAATDDPIFVAIEAHKAAFARVIAAIDVEQAAEAATPKGVRKTDERYLEAGKAVGAAWETEGDAAIELVSVRPESMAGVMALLNYAISADSDGETWPRDLLSDDGETSGSWHHFLIQNLAEILPGLLRETTGETV
jgi:hypothetical protein